MSGIEPLEVWHKDFMLECIFFFFERSWAVNCSFDFYPATEPSASEGVFAPLIYDFQTKQIIPEDEPIYLFLLHIKTATERRLDKEKGGGKTKEREKPPEGFS